MASNRIAEERKRTGMTQQELADRLGLHWVTISKLERGKIKLDTERLGQIAEALGTSVGTLVDAEAKEDGARAYVSHVMEQLNMTPSALAKRAGLASTTLTRSLNDPSHKFTLSNSTLKKIAEFSGIDFGPFFQSSAKQALDVNALQGRVIQAIFDPSTYAGAKGDRQKEVWQTHAVMFVFQEFFGSVDNSGGKRG